MPKMMNQAMGSHVTYMVIGGGAPYQQINTRAYGQSSLHEVASIEPSLQDDDGIEQIVYETDEGGFEDNPKGKGREEKGRDC